MFIQFTLSLIFVLILITPSSPQINTTFIKGLEITTWREEVLDDPVDILVELEFNHSLPFTENNYSISININNSTTRETYDVLSSYTNETIIDNRVARFNWNPRKLTRNSFYEIEAKLYNYHFEHFETLTSKVKKLNERKDNIFYVDSKLIAWSNSIVFFPLGFYTSNISSLDFSFLAQSSFNILISLEYLAHEDITRVFNETNGKIRVINKIPPSVYDIVDEQEFIGNFTWYLSESMKSVKGFLGYLFYENPSIELIPRLTEAVWLARNYAPNHPIYVTLNNTQRIREYKVTFDIVGISILANQTDFQDVNMIWKECSIVRDGLINNKALWNAPSFSNEDLNESELELRTFQWIASGSNGIVFRHEGHENTFSINAFTKINRIINRIHDNYLPIIVSSDDINPHYEIANNPNFVLRQFRYSGKDYFLIVNSNSSEATYIFNATNSTNGVKYYKGNATQSKVSITIKKKEVHIKLPGSTWVWIECNDYRYKVMERYFPFVFIIPIILCVVGFGVFCVIKKKKEKYEINIKNPGKSSLSHSFNNPDNSGGLSGHFI